MVRKKIRPKKKRGRKEDESVLTGNLSKIPTPISEIQAVEEHRNAQ